MLVMVMMIIMYIWHIIFLSINNKENHIYYTITITLTKKIAARLVLVRRRAVLDGELPLHLCEVRRPVSCATDDFILLDHLFTHWFYVIISKYSGKSRLRAPRLERQPREQS